MINTLEKILRTYEMPEENIYDAVEMIKETYGEERFLEGVELGVKAVDLLEKQKNASRANVVVARFD